MQHRAGIYSLVNTHNNFRYIDSSINVESAIKNVLNKLDKNQHKNLRLQDAWNKHRSYFKYEVLEYVSEPSLLHERKIYWINRFRSNNVEYGYNLEILKRPWEIEREIKLKSEKWNVVGDIREILRNIVSELNYDLKYAKDRLELIHKILTKERLDWLINYFSSPGFINKQVKNKNSFLTENDKSLVLLNNLVDYLVFPKYIDPQTEHEDKDIKLRKSKVNLTYGNNKKEILIPDAESIEKLESKISKSDLLKSKSKVKNKQTITKDDIKNNKFIRQIYSAINDLNKLLENQNTNIRDKHVIKRAISKLKDDAILTKDQLNGTIYFKRLTKGTTVYNFDVDTGYFEDQIVNGKVVYGDYKLISENKIDFRKEKHIKELLNHYSELKDKCFYKVDSDIWHILMDFEELVRSVKFEDYIRDILFMRLQGYRNDEISSEIKRKYNIDFDVKRISKIYNETIPKIIVEKYEEMYDDWLYTFKVKGEYKKCSKCGNIKLQKYFGSKKDSKDGLHTICKSCR